MSTFAHFHYLLLAHILLTKELIKLHDAVLLTACKLVTIRILSLEGRILTFCVCVCAFWMMGWVVWNGKKSFQKTQSCFVRQPGQNTASIIIFKGTFIKTKNGYMHPCLHIMYTFIILTIIIITTMVHEVQSCILSRCYVLHNPATLSVQSHLGPILVLTLLKLKDMLNVSYRILVINIMHEDQ